MRPPIDEVNPKNTDGKYSIATVLVALLIGLVAFPLLFPPHYSTGLETGTAHHDLDFFDGGLKRYPTNNEGLRVLLNFDDVHPAGWKGPYLEGTFEIVPRDPWGHDFIYRSPGGQGKPFDLYSCGPSGVDRGGGGDNIADPKAGK